MSDKMKCPKCGNEDQQHMLNLIYGDMQCGVCNHRYQTVEDQANYDTMTETFAGDRLRDLEETIKQLQEKLDRQQAKFASWEEYQDHVEKLLLSIYGYLLRDIDEHQRRELRLRIIETRDGIYFGMEESDE